AATGDGVAELVWVPMAGASTESSACPAEVSATFATVFATSTAAGAGPRGAAAGGGGAAASAVGSSPRSGGEPRGEPRRDRLLHSRRKSMQRRISPIAD